VSAVEAVEVTKRYEVIVALAAGGVFAVGSGIIRTVLDVLPFGQA
jgi:hypothetical protein